VSEPISLGSYRASGEGIDKEHATAEARNGDIVITLPDGKPFFMAPASARTWAHGLLEVADTAQSQREAMADV
jgi:hypothetical protein